jgi:hypothetical protein
MKEEQIKGKKLKKKILKGNTKLLIYMARISTWGNYKFLRISTELILGSFSAENC